MWSGVFGVSGPLLPPTKMLLHEKETENNARASELANAEGKGSTQHGQIIKVAYRAPAAQAYNPPVTYFGSKNVQFYPPPP